MNAPGTDNTLGSYYVGVHEYAVDAQRRVALPKGWRKGGAEGAHFFLFPGRKKSLQLVPAQLFQQLLSKLQKVSFADEKAAIALASIGMMTQEIFLDKQGRMAMSADLMCHAGIEDKALMIGSVTTIQIWNPDIWAEKQVSSEAGLDVLQAIHERPDDISEVLRNVVRG